MVRKAGRDHVNGNMLSCKAVTGYTRSDDHVDIMTAWDPEGNAIKVDTATFTFDPKEKYTPTGAATGT